MIARRPATAFLRFAVGSRDRMNEPTHFDLVTIGGGFADHARQCSKPAPTSCLMLTVLGGLAEFERDWIRTRTSEGRERPKARGVKLGRKPKLTGHQRREAIWRRD